jgi:hypothetical protein
MVGVNNPYLRQPQPWPQAAAVAAAAAAVAVETTLIGEMGPQSQRRNTLNQRRHQLQSTASIYKKRKGDGTQKTLSGERAIDPEIDCPICKAKRIGYPPPHRGHDPRCWNNRRTKGLSQTTLESIKESKRLEAHFAQPVQPHERFSSRNNTQAACDKFFAPRPTKKVKTVSTTEKHTMSILTADNYCAAVAKQLSDPKFVEEHKNKEAPLAMLALAGYVRDNIINSDNKQALRNHFHGCTFTVPPSKKMNPHYHSIVGHKLLFVDWRKTTHSVQIPCGLASCDGILKEERSNFSKNKVLFPVFTIDGPPLWCITIRMICTKCKRSVKSHESEILSRLPMHVAAAYPVYSEWALPGRECHISRRRCL